MISIQKLRFIHFVICFYVSSSESRVTAVSVYDNRLVFVFDIIFALEKENFFLDTREMICENHAPDLLFNLTCGIKKKIRTEDLITAYAMLQPGVVIPNLHVNMRFIRSHSSAKIFIFTVSYDRLHQNKHNLQKISA